MFFPINYIQPPLVHSDLNEDCVDGKATILQIALLGTERRELHVDLRPQLWTVFQVFEPCFGIITDKLHTLSIKLMASACFMFDAIESAFSRLDLLFGGPRVASHLDRILFDTFGETSIESTPEIS
jgi:hypothetical protein